MELEREGPRPLLIRDVMLDFSVYNPRLNKGRERKLEPWPPILLPLKMFRKPGDRGAGDIIARVIGPIGGDAFKTWYRRLFGQDCGCGNRQEALNQRWPL